MKSTSDKTDENLRSELLFLIAKYLKSEFPDVGDIFVKKCDELHLFPQRVFTSTSAYKDLVEKSFFGIPDDQLMKIVSLALPDVTYPSLLFSPPSKSEISQAQIMSKKIQNISPPLSHFSFRGFVTGHLDKIYCLAVDKTSQILITGSDDSRIKIWHIPSLKLIRTLFYHSGVISDLTIHPTNLFFSASSHDHSISFISMQTGLLIRILTMSKEVHAVRFSPCGKYFAAACEEGCVSVWSVETALSGGNPFKIIQTPQFTPAAWVNFSPGSRFLIISADPNVVMVSAICPENSNQVDKVIPLIGHTNLADFVFFSKKTCSLLFSVSLKDKGFRIWQNPISPPKKNKAIIPWSQCYEFYPSEPGNSRPDLKAVQLNSDESKIIAANNTTVFVYNLLKKNIDSDGFHLLTIGKDPVYTNHITVIACHPFYPDIAFFGTKTGISSLWDISHASILCSLQDSEGPELLEAVWSPDGHNLYASDASGRISIYNCGISPISSSEQFFKSEIIPMSNENIFVDGSGNQLEPQPKPIDLESLKLSINKKPINHQIRAEEAIYYKLFIDSPNPIENKEVEDGVNPEENSMNDDLDEDERLALQMYEEDSINYMASRRHRNSRTSRTTEEEDEEWDPSKEQSENEYLNEQRERTRERSEHRKQKEKERREKRKNTRSHRKIENEYTYNDDDDEWSEVDSEGSFEQYSSSLSSEDELYSKLKRPQNSYFALSSDDDVIQLRERKTINYQTSSETSELESDSLEEKKSKQKSKEEKKEDDSNYIDENDKKEITQLPEWTFNAERKQYQYIPQVGEKIVYSRAAHLDFSSSADLDSFPPPYELQPNLPDITYAKITDSDFFIKGLVLTLQFTEQEFVSQILYNIPESAPYIIPQTLFELSMNKVKSIFPNDKISVAFTGDEGKIEIFSASINSIKENWEKSPYNSIEITFDLDQSEALISPWEILMDEPISPQMNQFQEAFENISEIICNNEEYAEFADLRTEEMNNLRLKAATRPIDTKLFLARLKNRYYKTIDELMSDIMLFNSNASLLNLSVSNAQKLTDELLTKLEMMKPPLD